MPTSLARLAVVCPSWVGDTVMCTPVFRALRQHRPGARIAAIVRPGLDQVLAGLPWIDSTIVSEMKGLFGPQRLAKVIRRVDAQAVLLLPNSFRAAMGARIAGASIRIGYDRDGRGSLLTHKVDPGRIDVPVPMVDYYARLACFALGIQGLDTRVELNVTAEEQAAAEAMLADIATPFVVLNPGANRADKRWPAERFAMVGEQLSEQRGWSVVISGSPAEMELLEAVERASRRPVTNLAKRGVTLGALKAVLRRAALLVTNDTGPRHIAAALGTPVVTLFGPTDHRWTTLRGVRERIVLAEPFLPEELVADKHAKAEAIDKISLSDVLAAANSLVG